MCVTSDIIVGLSQVEASGSYYTVYIVLYIKKSLWQHGERRLELNHEPNALYTARLAYVNAHNLSFGHGSWCALACVHTAQMQTISGTVCFMRMHA